MPDTPTLNPPGTPSPLPTISDRARLTMLLVAVAFLIRGLFYVSSTSIDGRHAPLNSRPIAQVDINTCDAAELAMLPEVGPQLAQRILKHREIHGPFVRFEQLGDVVGIGEATLSQLQPYVLITADR